MMGFFPKARQICYKLCKLVPDNTGEITRMFYEADNSALQTDTLTGIA